jgi:3-methyladenine DNA glycosylase Tag
MGIPTFDDARLFEMLVLEVPRPGSPDYRLRSAKGIGSCSRLRCQPHRPAHGSQLMLLLDPRIIRNRLKVYGTVRMRAHILRSRKFGSFVDYIWRFVDHRPSRTTGAPCGRSATTAVSTKSART